jgi:inner membrane protein
MMAGSHLVLGAATWMAMAPLLGHDAFAPVSLALALAGSLAPDIDHPGSWLGLRIRPVSTILGKMLGHRGVTHSLAAVAGCCWLLMSRHVSHAIMAPFLVGYLSHLAGDVLTSGGLRLFWPIKGTWALPLCRTGSPTEPLVIAGLLACLWFGKDIGLMTMKWFHAIGL